MRQHGVGVVAGEFGGTQEPLQGAERLVGGQRLALVGGQRPGGGETVERGRGAAGGDHPGEDVDHAVDVGHGRAGVNLGLLALSERGPLALVALDDVGQNRGRGAGADSNVCPGQRWSGRRESNPRS